MGKRCMKTVLSVLLAIAMLITAAPADLTLTVQAAETGVEEPQSAVGAENVGGGVNSEVTNPDDGIMTMSEADDPDDSDVPDDPEMSDDPEPEEPDPPTNPTATTEHKVEGKTVTFICVPGAGFFENSVTVTGGQDSTNTIVVKGGYVGQSWSDWTTLKDADGDGVWEGESKTLASGKYWYKFVANGETYEAGGNRSLFVAGLGDASIDVKTNATTDLPSELESYYASADAAPEAKAVTYEANSDATEKGVTLGTNGAKQTVIVPSSVEPGASFTLTAKNADDASDTSIVTVNVVKILSDPSVVSPVPGKGEATFYYYAPKPATELVKIKGAMLDWGVQPMTYNEDTGYWSITLKMAVGSYEYGFLQYAPGDDTSNNNDFWRKDPLNTGTKADNGNDLVVVTEPGESIEAGSPLIDGKTVKFIYENAEAYRVYVAGGMSGWGDAVNSTEYKMKKTRDDEGKWTGFWELEKEMSPGVYQYKYIWQKKDDTTLNWVTDPLNPVKEDGNSKFIVSGLVDSDIEVERTGKVAELPAQLALYAADGAKTEATVAYALEDESLTAADKAKITLSSAGGKQTISVAADFPKTIESFKLTAAAATGEKSTLTVNVVDQKYKYEIYYFDEDNLNPTADKAHEKASLWIYSDGVNGTEYGFKEVVEEGGYNWLKAEVELSLTKLSIIPRSPGVWNWQDTTREYKRPDDRDKDAVTKLYIIFGDDANIYEKIPATVRQPKRYLVIEYERSDAIRTDNKSWKIYTWNSGYGSNVYADFVPDDDNPNKGTATVKIKKGLESLSFCMAKAPDSVKDNHDEKLWDKKDGGDHRVEVPIDQQVVKVKMEEGKGVTYTYPYNTGYELEPAENTIHFYYRDDDVFVESDTDDSTVTLEVGTKKADGTLDATNQPMTFNADADKAANDNMDTQRFSADVALSTERDKITYYYRYKVAGGDEDNDPYVLDNFNTARETIGGVEYSVCTYEKPDLEISAEMQNASMDYNENNVLTVSFKEKGVSAAAADTEGTAEVAAPKVSKAVVDLSAVGGSAETQIDPELLEISIAVKESIGTGEKNLPIVVYDEYGNEYKTSASVNVAARNKGDDFDWDEAVIYFAVTDRFFDGNAGNNGIGYNVGEYGSSSYHGGDFAGLTQKLDYLNDLGVNTIWITPIVEQQTTANSDDQVGESWGYHGYWAKNFENLDSHLGTEAEFKALLDAAHARGMKVMVDVVLNHAGYGEEVKEYFNSQLKDEEGNFIPMIRESKDMINGNDQKSSLSGLQDFLTENKEVRDLLVEWQSNWISKYDIDYYRVDTVKHVDNTTWSAFKNALTRINPDFKMIGEWAGAGYATDTGTLGEGRMDSLLDFDFNNRATDFVKGNIAATEDFMVARNNAINNTAELGAFLGSHDEDGFAYALTASGMDSTKAQDLALVAASLQLTAKGQVVIYYGEEIGMTGANNYPWQTNRYDFDWAEVNSSNAALAHYKAMLAIRNRYSEVLAKGSRTTLVADDTTGLDVFSRSLGGTNLIVALNIDEERICTFSTGLPAGTVLYDYYASYKNGAGKTYTVGANGDVTITVPAAADGGTVVLTAGNPGFTTEDGQEGFDIKPIASKAYTGKNITLTDEELVVYYDGRALELKKDYTVSYKNNKLPGTATVTIKGKGNYAGTVTTEFEITRKNVADSDIVVDYKDLVYNGKAQNPISKITNSTSGVKLGKKDYTVKYYLLYANGSRAGSALSSVKADGRYQMEITGTGNYTGTKTKEFRIVKGGTYMNKTRITLKYNNAAIPKAGIPYSGKAITLQVEVKNGNDVLKQLIVYDDDDDEDDDGDPACYKVEYLNNTEVGTATVKIIGIPTAGYCGEVVKTFKIAGVALKSVAEVDSEKWQNAVELTYNAVTGNGAATQPKENEGLLKKKANADADATLTTDDYEVTYAKNDKPGTATVTFTGKRKYTGTFKKTFKVEAIDLSKLTTAANEGGSFYTVEAETPYRKKGAAAAVTVTYKDSVLEKDKHYKLTYSGNRNVTTGATANVKITGTGIFKGEINAKFAVTKQDLSSAPEGLLTAPDVVYSNKAGKFMSVPVLDGTKLKASDYTIKYYVTDNGNKTEKTNRDTVSSGTTVTVEVTPKSASATKNYTGIGTATYRVTEASIAKAKVSVKAKEYTGRAITLGKSDFSSVKVGKDKLVLGRDFEIVEGSYANNTNKGTASVTIKGIGNYSGEKKVTFKITSRFMRWWWNLFS